MSTVSWFAMALRAKPQECLKLSIPLKSLQTGQGNEISQR